MSELQENNMKSIAERIRKRRAALHLCYQELAGRTGLSKSTLQRYETGAIASIPLKNLETLARGLETTPEYLLGWSLRASTEEDDELLAYLDELKNRSEMRMLFSLAKNATKEDVEKTVRIISALRKDA